MHKSQAKRDDALHQIRSTVEPSMTTQTTPRERICPHTHYSIADAIRCAEKNLGILPGQKLDPYQGTTRENEGLIVGWQVSSRKRWRLDHDPKPGGKGPHVNEENFEVEQHLSKVVHLIPESLIAPGIQVNLQWKKWTAAGKVRK
jgi:hypothetical protein